MENSKKTMKKKSYNPFKMWGSWIGAIVGFILLYIFLAPFEGLGNSGSLFLNWKTYISLPIGFLLGWGIHSIVRVLRK